MKITDETIASLQKQLELLEPGRQHGKKGTVLSDSEAEKRRLYNNLASRLSRAKKKLLEQNKELAAAGAKENRYYRFCNGNIGFLHLLKK